MQRACHYPLSVAGERWYLEVTVGLDHSLAAVADVLDDRIGLVIRANDLWLVQQDEQPHRGWNGTLQGTSDGGSMLVVTRNNVNVGDEVSPGWLPECHWDAAAAVEGSDGRMDGPVFTSPPPPPGEREGMAARVMGTIALDDRGCLMLELEGIRYPIVRPAGTSWQPDPPAVLLPNDQIVQPGMSVLGGGGYLDSVAHMTGQEVSDAAKWCAGPTGEIAICNLGEEVTITG